MSNYKDNLKEILKKEVLAGQKVLSIGAQVDDRQYFGVVAPDIEYTTLDFDEEFKPNLVWDMNKPIMDEDGNTDFHDYYNKFDDVLTLNLWEYIYDPLTALKNCHFFLKSGGRFSGSFVFVYARHNPAGTDYLRYTEDGVRKLLTMSLFRDIQISPIKSNDLLTGYYESEQQRIRKDLDHNVAGYYVKARK